MRVARVRHGGRVLTIGVALGLLALTAAPAGAISTAIPTAPTFEASIYPSYTTAGFPTTFKVTVTNTSNQGTLHSVQLTPPRGFKLSPPGQGALARRLAVIRHGSVSLRGITVKPGASKPILVTATAARAQCGHVVHWSTRAFEGKTGSGTQLTLQPASSQIGVTVVCPKLAVCGDGGPPCSTGQPTKVSSYNVVDNASSGTLLGTLNVGRELNCPGYTNRDPNWYDSLLSGVQPSPAGTSPFLDTITYTIKGASPKGIGFCLGATYDFTTASGAVAMAATLPNGKAGFIGLLPLCTPAPPPCIESITPTPDSTVKAGYDTTLKVLVPEKGDPWGSS